jgi:hypothetical protein
VPGTGGARGRQATSVRRVAALASGARRVRVVTEDQRMSVQLNHTIVWCRDTRSATFLTEVLGGLPHAFRSLPRRRSDRSGVAQAANLRCGDANRTEHLLGVLAERRWRAGRNVLINRR